MFSGQDPGASMFPMQDPGTNMFSRFEPPSPFFPKQEPGIPNFAAMHGPHTSNFPMQPSTPTYSRQGPYTNRYPQYSLPDVNLPMDIPVKKEHKSPVRRHSAVNGNFVARQDATSQTDSPFSLDCINSSVKLKAVDSDIVEDLKSRPQDTLMDVLAHRSQLLRNLRANVCKMLQILIPDQTIPDAKGMSINDNTIDRLIEAVCKENDDSDNESNSSLEIVEVVNH